MVGELPGWASELVELYESGASSQFVLHGNVGDTFLLPLDGGGRSGDLEAFLRDVLLGSFEVVLFYDLGRGLRATKGEAFVEEWPSFAKHGGYPRRPGEAVAFVDHFLRYVAALASMGTKRLRVAVVIKSAGLVVPAAGHSLNYELSAMALMVRAWSGEPKIGACGAATFLVTENLNDLNPLLVNNPRAAHLEIPLPGRREMQAALEYWKPRYGVALGKLGDGEEAGAAGQLAGASLSSVETLVKRREHTGEPLVAEDLAELKKELVEKDCNGLIEFIESDRTLDDVHGNEAIKAWLRQDIALWAANDLKALPMGYLFCGPVGTGKTYLVKCLAGEAGVPVVKFKNFRDRWVGSTESNLEKIFRLLHALGRCVVFVDEADQALGKRGGGGGDSGVSGRVYSMMAEEMSKTANRGKILWILASSRPDLIEVDLKRPGRIDVKIPIFPAVSEEESFGLIEALCGKVGVELGDDAFRKLGVAVPKEMTAGAAEALAMKVYRRARTSGTSGLEALRECLKEYRSPVPKDVMDFQIGLAVAEASDAAFVPEAFL